MSTGNRSRKQAEELSKEFLRDLCNRIEHHDWDAVDNLLDSIEEGQILPNVYCESDYLIERETVLHVAAHAKIPSVVMHKLLKVVDKDFCFQPDEVGETPLLAIAHTVGTYIDTMLVLAAARPSDLLVKSSQGLAPLQRAMTNRFEGNTALALQMMLDLCPQAIHTRDPHGWNLLHYASMAAGNESFSLHVTKVLVDRKPSMILEQNNDGETPLHVSAKRPREDSVEKVKLFLERVGTGPLRIQTNKGLTALHLACLCRHCWSSSREMIELLVEADPSVLQMADYDGVIPFESFQRCYSRFIDRKEAEKALTLLAGTPVRLADSPSLHAVLRDERPVMLLKAHCVYLLSDQLSTVDEHGDLPLHIVAGMTPPRVRRVDRQFLELLRGTLNGYTDACNVRSRDGVLPLGLMLRSGHTWDRGARLVFEAYPAAVEQLASDDLITLLSNLGDDHDGLQGIYLLLRSAPSLMRT
jgi:ankyrin repeat protein